MKQRIGLQLYSVRDLLDGDVLGMLKKVAACGYTCVEFAGYYGLEAAELLQLCQEAGLEPYSSHVPLERLRDELPKVVEEAKTLGLSYVICPYATFETVEDIDQVAGLLNQAAEALRAVGCRVGYHNHHHEIQKLEGCDKNIFEMLIDRYARPDMVAEVDSCWAFVGGAELPAWIGSLGSVAGPLHFKDVGKTWKAGSHEGLDVPVGEGQLDFAALLETMQEEGTLERGVIVEQEGFGQDPWGELAASVQHIQSVWPQNR